MTKLPMFVAAILMALILTACGASDTSNMGAPEQSNADCENGLDGNGNCLKDGATGIPDH